MLIKVLNDRDDAIFINEDSIVFVKRGAYREVHCWRVEVNEDVVIFLPVDKNKPFAEWLKYQIGGEYWQKEVDRWAAIEVQMSNVTDRGEMTTTSTGQKEGTRCLAFGKTNKS